MVDDSEDDDSEPEASPIYPSKGPNREDMASSYLPEGEDWLAKTAVDLEDPAAIAALSEFGSMYPEVDDLQELIDGFLHHFLKGKTSIGGRSREEYRSILVSMYGGNIDEDTARGAFIDALASDIDDD